MVGACRYTSPMTDNPMAGYMAGANHAERHDSYRCPSVCSAGRCGLVTGHAEDRSEPVVRHAIDVWVDGEHRYWRWLDDGDPVLEPVRLPWLTYERMPWSPIYSLEAKPGGYPRNIRRRRGL
jgi:hypothetical protein